MAVALNVIVTVSPGRIAAKLHRTCVPIAEHIPDADVACVMPMPAGTLSVTTTLVAAVVPTLPSVSV